MIIFKIKLEEYTEEEFLNFIEEISANTQNLHGKEREEYVHRLVKHFELVTEHPGKSDVIFYPEDHREDSSKGILTEVKRWRAAAGKPGFKAP
jgi:hypothetical protein